MISIAPTVKPQPNATYDHEAEIGADMDNAKQNRVFGRHCQVCPLLIARHWMALRGGLDEVIQAAHGADLGKGEGLDGKIATNDQNNHGMEIIGEESGTSQGCAGFDLLKRRTLL